jgi:hypothetical protein
VASFDNGVLELDLTAASPEQDSMMQIDAPFELDSASATTLGVSTIVPGTYTASYDHNAYGTFSVQARSAGVASVAIEQTAGTIGAARALPNPTSGTTTIGFTLGRTSPVTVTLLDARGSQIARLLDAPSMEAGRQTVGFDAGTLPSGVYYYTIRSLSGVETGSVVVTR